MTITRPSDWLNKLYLQNLIKMSHEMISSIEKANDLDLSILPLNYPHIKY